MSHVNKNAELEVQKRSNELRKLKTEERVMRSMLDEAQGQLTKLQYEALEIKSRIRGTAKQQAPDEKLDDYQRTNTRNNPKTNC